MDDNNVFVSIVIKRRVNIGNFIDFINHVADDYESYTSLNSFYNVSIHLLTKYEFTFVKCFIFRIGIYE